MAGYNNPIFTKGIVEYSDFDLAFRANPVTGDLNKKKDLDAIKQSLYNLLYTRFGDRPFQPGIGGNLSDLLFEPLDDITKYELEQAITTTINNFEPRVRILTLSVTDAPDDHELNVSLKFEVVNIAGNQAINFILKRVR